MVAPLLALGLAGSAANMIGGHFGRRRAKRSQRRAFDRLAQSLESKRSYLKDVQRRQGLGLEDANIGLEGGVMDAKRRNLATDQKYDMDQLSQAISDARHRRADASQLAKFDDMTQFAGGIGGMALALSGLSKEGPIAASTPEQPANPWMQGGTLGYNQMDDSTILELLMGLKK